VGLLDLGLLVLVLTLFFGALAEDGRLLDGQQRLAPDVLGQR